MAEPPAGARVAETIITVRSYELDAFNHAHHAVFLNYLEAARYDALHQGGFPYEDMMARGWGVYVVRLEIDYLKEARLGDRLRIRTWADEYRRSSVTLAQVIVRDEDPGQMLARSRVTAVWVECAPASTTRCRERELRPLQTS